MGVEFDVIQCYGAPSANVQWKCGVYSLCIEYPFLPKIGMKLLGALNAIEKIQSLFVGRKLENEVANC